MSGSPAIASLFPQRVIIGVGDLAVSNNAQVTLTTYALGSCIGVTAYDPVVRAGGILHFMLPEAAISPDKASRQPAMFADTGLPAFMRALAGVKAVPARLRVFLAGGACVLAGPDIFRIGERNAACIRSLLADTPVRIVGADTGGTVNRTVHLELATGLVSLKMPDRSSQVQLA